MPLLRGASRGLAADLVVLCLMPIFLLAAGGHENTNGSYQPLTRKGDSQHIADLALIYLGGTGRLPYSPDQFEPYVTALGPDGKEHWLFDGFLMIEFATTRPSSTDGHGFTRDFAANGRVPARQAEWTWLLDRFFGLPTSNAVKPGLFGLPALDRAVRDATTRIGPPQRRRQVVLALPEPIVPRDGDPKYWNATVDMSTPAGRASACTWYIDAALERWRKGAFANLELSGFYWAEDARENLAIVPHIAKYLHKNHLQFYFIPSWNGRTQLPERGGWQSMGFDAVFLQPNYYQRPPNHPQAAPETRLTEAAAVARKNGLGLEMEFDSCVEPSRSKPCAYGDSTVFIPRLEKYIQDFTLQGVDTGASVAYYDGGGEILRLSRSTTPVERGLYDLIAQWVLKRQAAADRQAAPRAP